MKSDDLANAVEECAQGLLDWSGIWSDLAGVWTGWFGELGGKAAGICLSEVFSAPPSADRRMLKLRGPLVAGVDRKGQNAALAEELVRFEPRALAPGKTDFQVVVTASAAHCAAAGVYVGQVCTAFSGDVDDAGDADDPIQVWIVIP